MKPQSAKAKGRKLQQWFRDLLIKILNSNTEDIQSTSMGAGGEDIKMASIVRAKFPYSIECKNQEKLNIYKAYDQAKANSSDYEPLLVIKKNQKKPLVVLDAEHFVNLYREESMKSLDYDYLLARYQEMKNRERILDEMQSGQNEEPMDDCPCGKKDCPERYEHTTSGF